MSESENKMDVNQNSDKLPPTEERRKYKKPTMSNKVRPSSPINTSNMPPPPPRKKNKPSSPDKEKDAAVSSNGKDKDTSFHIEEYETDELVVPLPESNMTRDISVEISDTSPVCHMGKGSDMKKLDDCKSVTEQPSKDGRKLAMLLRSSQCVQFKSLIECLKELLSEVNIDFIQDKGMRLVSIDPGRVGMVHLDVNNIEYFYAKDIVTAGISMIHLYRMIRSMTSGDFMEWRIYEDDMHRMEIELSNSERRTKTVNSIKLLDLDEVDIVIPQVEFDRVVSMPSSELSKHVREMATVSPYITIRGTRTTLELLAQGEMSESHVIIQPTASGLNWRHSEDGDDIEGKYFAKYIEKFTKNSLANNVELFLKNNYPLIMRFEISIGCLRCCIAPIQEKA